MLVQHDTDGRIQNIVFDPVPKGLRVTYDEMGLTVVNLPPIPLPPELIFDAEGNPVMHEVSDPAVDDDGELVLDDDGNQVFVVSEEQLIESPGVKSAVVDPLRDYVRDGLVVKRPVFDLPAEIAIVADGVDEALITPLPDPCMARIDGADCMIGEGLLAVVSDMPAQYVIELLQWPYMPHTIKVTAHAPDA